MKCEYILIILIVSIIFFKKKNNNYEHMTTNSLNSDDINSINTMNTGIINNYSVPKGIISIWAGYVNRIPAGWVLCDGSKLADGYVTPDLRARFIIGAGGSYKPNDKPSDKENVKLTVNELPRHRHTHNHNIAHYHDFNIREGNSYASSNGFGSWYNYGYSGLPNSHVDSKAIKKPTLMAFQPEGKGAYSNHQGSDKTGSDLITNAWGNYTSTGDSLYGKDGAHENRPPYYVLSYIIKI